jgi:hypothetical protein
LDLGVLKLGILQHLIHGFPLSGPESGHTAHRQPARDPRETSQPFSFIRTLTVGFGIAPNLLTLFRRSFSEKKALAGLGCFTLTAGGEFHPALRTSSRPNDGSGRTMPARAAPDKRLRSGKSAWRPGSQTLIRTS